MYTIKVKFCNWGKVYHFASQNTYTVGETIQVVSDGEYKDVKYVGHERGISPKATKWRSGSTVSQQQRLQYLHKDYKKETIMAATNPKITEEEILQAFDTLNKIASSPNVEHFQPRYDASFPNGGKYFIAYKGSSEQYTNTQKAVELARLVNINPRKGVLQAALDKLLEEAAKIQEEIRCI